MAPSDHAPFSPSASARWLLCPYSVPLGQRPPESPPNRSSVIGQRMHSQAERHLLAGTDPAKECFSLKVAEPNTTNVIDIPQADWHAHVVPYVAAVREVYEHLELLGGEPELLVEQKVTISGEDCYGTMDAAVVSLPLQVFHIFDLKTGRHDVAACAPQFATYGCGVCNRYGWDRFKLAVFHRLQAEADEPHDKFQCVPEDFLRPHYKMIVQAIKTSKAGGTPTQANIGPHCDFCPLRPKCPAHFGQAMMALEAADAHEVVAQPAKGKKAAGAPVIKMETRPFDQIPLDKVLWCLAHREEIVGWLKSLEGWAIERTARGDPLLGWKVVAGRSLRRWRKDMEKDAIANDIKDSADMLGVELDPWKRELVSFTQVEKTLGKGSIDHLVEKPDGKPTLVPEEDKRPALDLSGVNALAALAATEEGEDE